MPPVSTPRIFTNPSALYRIERRLVPAARKAFALAVAAWLRDVKAGRLPDPQALKPLVKVTRDGTRLAGVAAAAQVGGFRPGVSLVFDLTNPRAVAWAKANAARLIAEIGDETVAAVRAAIVRSMRGDLTVQQVARYVRDIVGLTARQEQAVYTVYDKAIEAGLEHAEALAESQIKAMKLRKFRSEAIARSEVLRAENAGQELLWQQAKEAGYMPGLVKIWLATPDELWCDICKRMHHRTAEIGAPWIDPETGESYDVPQATHPQCRCSSGLTEMKRADRAGRGSAAKGWDESQHPRDEHGRWTDSGGAVLDVTENVSVEVSSKVSAHDSDVVKNAVAAVPNDVLRTLGPVNVRIVDVLRDGRGKRLPYAGLCQWDVEKQQLHIEVATRYWGGDDGRVAETVQHEIGHAIQRHHNISNATAHWEDEGAQARAPRESILGRASALFPHYVHSPAESFAQGVAVHFSQSDSRAEAARHYREAFPRVMANVEAELARIGGGS